MSKINIQYTITFTSTLPIDEVLAAIGLVSDGDTLKLDTKKIAGTPSHRARKDTERRKVSAADAADAEDQVKRLVYKLSDNGYYQKVDVVASLQKLQINHETLMQSSWPAGSAESRLRTAVNRNGRIAAGG